MYEYKATVNEVTDGDTVNLSVDLGFFPIFFRLKRARLYGIDAPEKNTEAGKAAKAYLVGRLPVGCKIRIKTIKPPKSEYEKDEKFGGLSRSISTGINLKFRPSQNLIFPSSTP